MLPLGFSQQRTEHGETAPIANSEWGLPAHQILCWHLLLWGPELTQKASMYSGVTNSLDETKCSGRFYKMASFIKKRSFHSRMFKEPLLLHKAIQWLSRGKVLNRVSELKGVLWKQQKARFCWILWRWRMAAETSQCGTDSSVSVRYEEMFLTSRDKILGFKRKMHFWKTCYKKKSWIVPSAAWAGVKKGISKSQVLLETNWRSCRTKLNRFSFPFNTNVSLVNFFLTLLIVRILLEKKGRRPAVLYYQDEFYWSTPHKFWISVKKRISCYS